VRLMSGGGGGGGTGGGGGGVTSRGRESERSQLRQCP
jgi:hypothetical protein